MPKIIVACYSKTYPFRRKINVAFGVIRFFAHNLVKKSSVAKAIRSRFIISATKSNFFGAILEVRMGQDDALATVVEYIRAGDDSQAREALRGILRQHPNSADAWFLAAHLAPDLKKRKEILERVLKIEPLHQQARLAVKHLAETQQDTEQRTYSREVSPTIISTALTGGLLILAAIGVVLVLLLRPAHSAMPPAPEMKAGIDENGDASLCAILVQRHSNEEAQSYLQQLMTALTNNNFVQAGELGGRYRYCSIIDNFAYAWQLSTNRQFRSQAWQDFQNGWNRVGS